MSGGAFDYIENRMCEDIFGYECEVPRCCDGEEYEDDYKENYRLAVKRNPFHDAELSGLMFDMLYMVHALDFYDSGDVGEDAYKADVAWFKQKWLKSDTAERLKGLADIMYKNAQEQIEETIKNYEVKHDEAS